MATQGPTPVDTGATALVVTRPIDRAPAPVAPGPGTTGRIPTVATPQGPPESAPPAVTPGPGTGQSTGPAATVTPAVIELPVEIPTPADQGNNVIPTVPNLIEVLADGTIIIQNASALNFTGSGVTVTASGSTATLNITSGGGGDYGNSNVAGFMAAFGSNTVSTTGNVTGGYFLGDGSQLTGIIAASASAPTSNVTGDLWYDTTNQQLKVYTGASFLVVGPGYSTAQGISGAIPETILSNVGATRYITSLYINNVRVAIVNATAQFVPEAALLAAFPTIYPGITLSASVSGAGFAGTLQTAAQPNITTVGTLGNLAVSGQANVTQQINTARVSATGNITGNYFIGNGSLLTGIVANTGNVTFSGEIVIGTGTSNLISGLYLAPSSSSANANMYLRVRGNVIDEPTHIHFDTGNNAYYNQFIGDDNKYILLANTGNIVINANNNLGNSAQWTFGTDGNLSAPGNISAINLVINSIRSDDSTFVTIEDGVNISSGAISSQENLSLTANAYTWTFRNDGIGLVLPNSARITDTNLGALAIGYQAGFLSQANTAVAIGYQAALTAQGAGAVAIGRSAGNSQSDFAVAIGSYAGVTNQGNAAVAVGKEAGNTTQGFGAVAIGSSAGSNTQGGSAVALGDSAGQNSQGVYSVAIGYAAAQNNQGASAVAIGFYAGQTSQANNSIILNATGSALNQTTANTFTVAPVRNDVANIGNVMFYNATSKEITYGNVISVAGNITGGNILFGSGIVSGTGNITGGNILGGANVNATTHTGTTVSVSANVTGGNLITGALTSTASLSVTGNTATITTANYSVGYLNIPQISFAANATAALVDSGKHYYSTSASNLALTLADNSAVSWPVGTALSVINRGTANVTVAPAAGVSLYLAGNSTSANRVVTTYGMATVMNVAANIWMISGTVV